MTTIEQRDATLGPPPTLTNAQLLWTDPPYGTGKYQQQGKHRYHDPADTRYITDALTLWTECLDPDGTIVICCDYRLAADIITTIGWHYRGEIVWEFGLGRPRTSWWPVRHNNLLTFTRTATSGRFDPTANPRTKRLAPKPGYPADKPAGSVWDFTMSNKHPQRVGYANQKPTEIIEPFVLAHTEPDGIVVDPFCGSGSTGAAAIKHGRRFYGSDINIDTATTRLAQGFGDHPVVVNTTIEGDLVFEWGTT